MPTQRDAARQVKKQGTVMNWILLIFLHSGIMAHDNDVSITTARFYNQNACQIAGQEVANLASNTVQNVKFICIHDAEPK
jgi:hypothetical protein